MSKIVTRGWMICFALIGSLSSIILVAFTSAIAYGQTPNELAKYENKNLGISFEYPNYWNFTTTRIDNETCLDMNFCAVSFSLEDGLFFEISASRLNHSLILPVQGEITACNCNKINDFTQWNIKTLRIPHGTTVSENQTTVANNHSAYQLEEESYSARFLHVLTISNGIGYDMIYNGNSSVFDKHLAEVRGALNSINFINPEKLIATGDIKKIRLLTPRPLYQFGFSNFAKSLPSDQIEEVEKNPQSIINKCVDVLMGSKNHSDNLISYEKSQLDLCDSIALHFQDKCHDFNNLLPYCEFDINASQKLGTYSVDEYELKRITQLNCLKNIDYGSFCGDYFSNSTGSEQVIE